MPDIDLNRERWDGDYDWQALGEEWSEAWGNSSFEWWGTLFPRIHHFLPAERVLEIAPGFGRWSHYFANLADDYVGVDLSAECVEGANKRFSEKKHMKFLTNDGKSFPGVEEASVDFVFSFGSLIHTESDVIYSYLKEVKRVLRVDGVAFLHHSNIAASSLLQARPQNEHWRGETVSAAIVRRIAERSGLAVISQELLPWANQPNILSDCFSLLTPFASKHARGAATIRENWNFAAEQAALKELSTIYPSDYSS